MNKAEEKIRVLMVISYFHPYRAGAENQALLLSENLMKRDVEVLVLTRYFNDRLKFEYVNNIPVHRFIKTVEMGKLFGIAYFFYCLLFMFLKRKSYDIIHCHILHGFHSAAAVIIKMILKKKVVIKITSSGFTSDFITLKKVLFGSFILRFLKYADKIVALCSKSAEEAKKEGFSDNQIICIPNGVDTERFKPSGSYTEKRDRIVCVGRLIEIKGVDILMDAFRLLRDEGIRLKLEIFGDGQEKIRLKDKAMSLGISEDVIFHGLVQDIENYLNNTCLFVQSSLSEGMSNVILEAMAAGLPVVATHTGGAPDMIQSGSNGLLVEPGSYGQIRDAVKKVISDEPFAQKLGKQARKTIEEKYSIDIVTNQYIDLYNKIINS